VSSTGGAKNQHLTPSDVADFYRSHREQQREKFVSQLEEEGGGEKISFHFPPAIIFSPHNNKETAA
jgi:hypothetical protein